MNKLYTNTGKCIWCGKKEPETTFYTAPHILPKRLGGLETGFDVCDECNHYFGTAEQIGRPCMDHAFKEVFGAIRMFTSQLGPDSYKKFRSAYFSYHHEGHLIKIKRNFNSHAVTRQFKRSLYEVFLQKYHQFTGDGNNNIFSMVRDFARYDIGNPHVFYAYNNVILSPDDNTKEHPFLPMSQKLIDDMFEYGYFNFWLMGHNFYLEIFPTIASIKEYSYLQNQANHTLISAHGNEAIYEFNDISQIDFFMQRFNSQVPRYVFFDSI